MDVTKEEVKIRLDEKRFTTLDTVVKIKTTLLGRLMRRNRLLLYRMTNYCEMKTRKKEE